MSESGNNPKNTPNTPKEEENLEELRKKTERLKAKKFEQEIKELEEQNKKKRQLFNFGGARRRLGRGGVYIGIIVLVLLPVIVFFVLSSTTHQGLFSYNLQAYYTGVFHPISSVVSPLFSLFTSQISCLSNPVACVGQQNQNQTITVYPTFTSFLTVTPASNPQTVFLTGNNTPSTLFYTVLNNANVPLGSATNNVLILNESCGSTYNSPETKVCLATTSPVIMHNGSFYGALLSSQSITNETKISVSCPSKSSNVVLPSLSSIILNFTVKNYSAGSLIPIQFVSQSFSNQLLASSQPLEPSQPSISFVTPGPLQISMSVVEPMPIITGTGSVPMTITIENKGTVTNSYKVNSLSLFIPMSLWPSNPQSSGWDCVASTSSIRMQFAIPGGSYWDCKSTSSDQQLQAGGTQLVLPQVTSLSSLHFDTVPIFAYMNYDYYEYTNMPYKISASGSVCG